MAINQNSILKLFLTYSFGFYAYDLLGSVFALEASTASIIDIVMGGSMILLINVGLYATSIKTNPRVYKISGIGILVVTLTAISLSLYPAVSGKQLKILNVGFALGDEVVPLYPTPAEPIVIGADSISNSDSNGTSITTNTIAGENALGLNDMVGVYSFNGLQLLLALIEFVLARNLWVVLDRHLVKKTVAFDSSVKDE